jgi:hypothetical protein
MTMISRIMLSAGVAVVLIGNLFAAEPKASTLADRLVNVNHVALLMDKELGGYSVTVYSSAQQRRNLELEAKYVEDHRVYWEKVNAIRARRHIEKNGRLEVDNYQAMMAEEHAVAKPSLPSATARGAQLYRVISVGQDYLELRKEAGTGPISLVPLRFVHRVVFAEDDAGG